MRTSPFLHAVFSIFAIGLLHTVSSACAIPAPASLCPPVLNRGLISVHTECNNDTTAQIPNASGSWQYATDSSNDGIDVNTLGTNSAFEIFGTALLERPEDLCFAISGNLDYLNGAEGEGSGVVHYGDVFFNLSALSAVPSLTFEEASTQGQLFAIRFDAQNKSGGSCPGSVIGAFKNVRAKTVFSQVGGISSLGAYENRVLNAGGSVSYGDLGALATGPDGYFLTTTNANVIQDGECVGPIRLLDKAGIEAEGYDSSRFPGREVFGFCFPKRYFIDTCGELMGDGTSCLDCEGVPCGGKVEDACGICGGDGSACSRDCENTLGGSKSVDICGRCGGDGKSCLDCEGVPFGGKQFDKCGECGGDGSSCEEDCVQEKASRRVKKDSRRVRKTTRVLLTRTINFSNRATRCDDKERQKKIQRARTIFRQIARTLRSDITNTILVCATSVCTQSSTRRVKRQLKKRTRILTRLARNAKLSSIASCGVTQEAGPNAKRTEDFQSVANEAIDALPANTQDCT